MFYPYDSQVDAKVAKNAGVDKSFEYAKFSELNERHKKIEREKAILLDPSLL